MSERTEHVERLRKQSRDRFESRRVKSFDGLVVGRVYGVSGRGCMRLLETAAPPRKTTLTMQMSQKTTYWAGIEELYEAKETGPDAICRVFAKSHREAGMPDCADAYEAWQREIDEGRMP